MPLEKELSSCCQLIRRSSSTPTTEDFTAPYNEDDGNVIQRYGGNWSIATLAYSPGIIKDLLASFSSSVEPLASIE